MGGTSAKIKTVTHKNNKTVPVIAMILSRTLIIKAARERFTFFVIKTASLRLKAPV